MNGVNRQRAKNITDSRLPTKREKNYRLPTYQRAGHHNCIFSTFQVSNHKDTTDLNFIEKTKVKNRTFLVSMDVTSLFTNIPPKEVLNSLQSV